MPRNMTVWAFGAACLALSLSLDAATQGAATAAQQNTREISTDELQKILSTYFARYSFKHPEPRDFFAVASEVSGRDLTWFFDQVYRSSSVFDYGVDVFTSERIADRDRPRATAPVALISRLWARATSATAGSSATGGRPWAWRSRLSRAKCWAQVSSAR